MPGPLRRRCAAATTALLLAASVAACSDDSSEGSDEPTPAASSSEPTPSASPSPTSSEPPEPEQPEAPPAKDTVAGRQAFAEFVIETWSYALATNDASALTGLSPKAGPCQGCADLTAELKKRKKQGWYVDFPGVKVVKLPPPVTELDGVYVARATINVPRSTSYFDDGSVRNENDARKGATFEVRMRLDGKRYSLLAFRVS